jgi:alpha-L-rhamnosidase
MPRRLPYCLLLLALSPAVLSAAPRARRAPKVEVDGRPGGLKATRLRTEYQSAPLGLDVRAPRLSWVATPATEGRAARDQKQTAYQVLAASTPELLAANTGDLWDSEKVASAETFHVAWRGKPLRPGQRVHWKVRIWDRAELASPFSAPAWFEMGLLAPGDWRAQWIEAEMNKPDSEAQLYGRAPAPLFRKSFTVTKKIARARAYVSGLGYYELFLNGRRVGENVLDPAWTNYAKRVLYSTYDVTGLLQSGQNAVGMMVGNGWWNPLPLPMFKRASFRAALPVGMPRALLQLEISYADGSSERVVSDGTWKVGPSGLLRNDLFLGELFDARVQPDGWDKPGFDDARWLPARVARDPVGPLRAQDGPPVRVARRLRPVSVSEPRPGLFVFDMGQNFTGRVSLRVQGAKGTRVALRYADLLYPDGTPNGSTTFAGNIRTGGDEDRQAAPPEAGAAPRAAWQQDVYILSGRGVEIYTPRFTVHGFRYVAVEGYPGRPTLDTIEGQRLGSAVEQAGSFACSNPLYNRIQDTVVSTQLSNLLGVQTDCPTRGRLASGGEIVASSEAALFNFDLGRFYAKTVRDFAEAARPSGGFTQTAPFVGLEEQGFGDGSGPLGWALAHPALLQSLYVHYGDRALLEEQYGALTRWMDFLRRKIPTGLTDRDLGDPGAAPAAPAAFTGTAFYKQAAATAAEVARVLGRGADERKYAELAASIVTAANGKFLDAASGRYADGSQTAQAFALYQGLPPKEARPAALARLAEAVEKRGAHLATGAFGTKFLLSVLAAEGRPELAARIVDQRTLPSWGYALDNGATTLWEGWAKDERSACQNHTMSSSVAEWFFEHVGGIAPAPDAAGFDKIILRPRPTKQVSWAKTRHESVRGEIASEWSQEGGTFVWDVTVPIGASAVAYVPTSRESDVTEGGAPVSRAPGVKFVRMEEGAAVLELRPGRYRFTTRTAPRPK